MAITNYHASKEQVVNDAVCGLSQEAWKSPWSDAVIVIAYLGPGVAAWRGISVPDTFSVSYKRMASQNADSAAKSSLYNKADKYLLMSLSQVFLLKPQEFVQEFPRPRRTLCKSCSASSL